MKKKPSTQELEQQIQELQENIRRINKEWNRELRRAKEILKRMEGPK